MSRIARDWQCLNKRCNNIFEAWDNSPTCPKCKCVKVQWKPTGISIGKVAPSIDRTLRAQADRYGLSDMGQRGGTKAGEPAKPDAPQARVHGDVRPYTPAPGFSVPFTGTDQATCTWSQNAPSFKVRAPIEVAAGGAKFRHPKKIPTHVAAIDKRQIKV